MKRRTILSSGALLGLHALAGCGRDAGAGTDLQPPADLSIRHAKRFSLERRGSITVVRISSRSNDAALNSLLVLAPHGTPVPPLTGALAGASIVRTPVTRITLNNGADEAFLHELGATSRIVAVGGDKTYFDDIRAAVHARRIVQLGYDWHTPPHLDLLLTAQPDIFLMRLANLEHTASMERALALGIPSVPTFVEDETSYLGRAEWLMLFGLLLGQEERAHRLFAAIERRVAELKATANARVRVPVLWAYPQGADRWVATVRGPEAQLLHDAGGDNLLARDEDATRDPTEEISTEMLLTRGVTAQRWVIGDPHGAPIKNPALLGSVPAWRAGRLFTIAGRAKPQADAYDWFQGAVVRPDRVLNDFVHMIHAATPTAAEPHIRAIGKEMLS